MKIPNTKGAADMAALYALFGDEDEDVPACEPVETAAVPEPFRTLLAHEKHMTVTLERHINAPVNVHLIEVVQEGENDYARKILLTNSVTGQVVQFGIMRFNFAHCSAEVRDEIIEGATPLGRILINHDVLRSISTHSLLRIDPNPEMAELLELESPVPVYGRLATIFCNGEPAVDLLEVLAPGI